MDRYEIDELNKKVNVWLTVRGSQETIRGTSLRYEYRNGKKVWNTGRDLLSEIQYMSLEEIAARYSGCGVLYKMRWAIKNRRYRKKEISVGGEHYRNDCKKRWCKCCLSNNNWVRAERTGLYRLEVKDEHSNRRISVDFVYQRVRNEGINFNWLRYRIKKA